MKRFVALALLLVVFAVPAGAACINVQAGDWDDCSERRGAREPASWCGGGGGSSPGGSWRQRAAETWAEEIAKIKASLSFVGVFKPSPEID